MSITRSQARNRLRRDTAVQHASQIRASAVAMAARGRLDFAESVLMSILYFYHQRWGEGCGMTDLEAIFEHIMNIGVLDVLAAVVGTDGGSAAGAA